MFEETKHARASLGPHLACPARTTWCGTAQVWRSLRQPHLLGGSALKAGCAKNFLKFSEN